MAEKNTESTAVNELIELVATQKPLPPDPSEDLMFSEKPAPRRATKQMSPPRMTATVPPVRAAGEVAPLPPPARVPSGTQQGIKTIKMPPPPNVRISTAPPSRTVTIPPVAQAVSAQPPIAPPPLPPAIAQPPMPHASMTQAPMTLAPMTLDFEDENDVTNPEHDAMSRVTKPTLPPPLPTVRGVGPGTASRPSLSRPSLPTQSFDYPVVKHPAQELPVVTPPPPTVAPSIAAPLVLENELVTSAALTNPSMHAMRLGPDSTHQVPKAGDWKAIVGKLIAPMIVLVIVGIFVGGYFAFDGEGGKRRTPKSEAGKVSMPVTQAAAGGEAVKPDPNTAEQVAASADVKAEPAAAAKVDDPSAEPPSNTANTAASNTAASNTAASNTANTGASNTAASNTVAPNSANTAASNTVAPNSANTAASNTVAPNSANTAASNSGNTAASNTAASNAAASNTPNTAASNTAASNTAASNAAASNTAASNTAASNAAASNTPNTAASNMAASNTANTGASSTANTGASNTGASNTGASNTAASNTSATNAAASNTTAVAKPKLVDIRVDSNPSGATVNLIDRGKSMYLGTTPLSAAVDASRKYELVFSYENRSTVIESLDPSQRKRVTVRLSRARHSSSASEPKTDAKAEEPKRERHRSSSKKSGIDAALAGAIESPKAEEKKSEKTEKSESKPEPVAKANTGGEGTLMISSKPPCEIVIDGKATGLTTPQRSIPLPAGTHKITLVNSAEGIKKTVSVQITADKPTKVIQDFMK